MLEGRATEAELENFIGRSDPLDHSFLLILNISVDEERCGLPALSHVFPPTTKMYLMAPISDLIEQLAWEFLRANNVGPFVHSFSSVLNINF